MQHHWDLSIPVTISYTFFVGTRITYFGNLSSTIQNVFFNKLHDISPFENMTTTLNNWRMRKCMMFQNCKLVIVARVPCSSRVEPTNLS